MIGLTETQETRGRIDFWNLPRVTRNWFKDLTLQLSMIGLTETQETRGRIDFWNLPRVARYGFKDLTLQL